MDNPEKLSQVLTEFGLPEDFNLNSYGNWLPSCSSCNNKKSNTVFNSAPIILLHIQNAIKKSEKAQENENKAVSQRQLTRALNTLARAEESGELSEEIKLQLRPLIQFQLQERSPELQNKVIKLTPLYEVITESDGWKIIKGRYGVGARPIGENLHSSFNCPMCGTSGAWSGARCVICGEMSDD